MAWLVLVGAGSLEAVWAVALGKAESFTTLVPTLAFLVAIGARMAGLAYALRTKSCSHITAGGAARARTRDRLAMRSALVHQTPLTCNDATSSLPGEHGVH